MIRAASSSLSLDELPLKFCEHATNISEFPVFLFFFLAAFSSRNRCFLSSAVSRLEDSSPETRICIGTERSCEGSGSASGPFRAVAARLSSPHSSGGHAVGVETAVRALSAASCTRQSGIFVAACHSLAKGAHVLSSFSFSMALSRLSGSRQWPVFHAVISTMSSSLSSPLFFAGGVLASLDAGFFAVALARRDVVVFFVGFAGALEV